MLVFYFFCEEPRSKGKMKFEQMPDIPVMAGDCSAYGVACLQCLDSSLEVVVKGIFYWIPNFYCKVLLSKIFVFAV